MLRCNYDCCWLSFTNTNGVLARIHWMTLMSHSGPYVGFVAYLTSASILVFVINTLLVSTFLYLHKSFMLFLLYKASFEIPSLCGYCIQVLSIALLVWFFFLIVLLQDRSGCLLLVKHIVFVFVWREVSWPTMNPNALYWGSLQSIIIFMIWLRIIWLTKVEGSFFFCILERLTLYSTHVGCPKYFKAMNRVLPYINLSEEVVEQSFTTIYI